MPRFVVERTYTVGLDDMPAVGKRSRMVRNDGFPEITWGHSHVVVTDDGTVKSFCIYGAPSAEIIREHADKLGWHTVNAIYEIAGDVTPDDFPLD
ncbi:MAG TPA: nickel-binding protein [Gaiellaceae bacterium]|nr:nickel-binding protein [Gaiellaceae bacterium]